MLIDSNTKISQLLKENTRALDVISSLAKPLEKLRNPILRKLMASRTTLQQAADISGCNVEEFFLVLRPLGFEIGEAGCEMPDKDDQDNLPKPEWLNTLTAEKIVTFDVRQMLSNGHDPLKEIMAEYKKILPGAALKIVNTFIPTPLLRLLENKGAMTYSQKIEPRLSYSYFLKPPAEINHRNSPTAVKETAASTDQIKTVSEASFKESLSKFAASQLKEIDVRDLEMPEPMQAILRELEQLPLNSGLYVHHKRIPVYLLEDVQASGKYQVFILPLAETRVDLLLIHNG